MQTAILKLTSAIAIAGVICKAGDIVEVPEQAAKNLLHRGKAVLATADDEGGGSDEGDDKRDAPDLSKLNKAQLLEAAAAAGVTDVTDQNTKAEILAAIEAATGDE